MRKIILLLALIIITSCSSDEPTKTPVPTDPVVVKPLAATFTKVDVAVYGGNTGSVTFMPAGGTPPYTISPSQTGLTAGNYTFIITDSKGLSLSTIVEITQPKATLPQSALLKPAVKNINKKSASGKRNETVKHLVQSIQYEKDKYIIDQTADYSLTDNLYAVSEDALNVNTPKGDVRTYTYNELGQLIRIDILKGPNSLGSSGIEFSYEYDSNGNVINNSTPYTYVNGLITNVLVDGYSTTYTYDSSGRVIHRSGALNASTFEYTDDEVKETRYDVLPAQGEVATGRVVITKYDGTKAGIYNNEPYYKIATTFSTLLGQTLPNPYLHIIEQKLVDNGAVQKSQTYKYFYDTDGYLIKVDDGAYVTIYIYQ